MATANVLNLTEDNFDAEVLSAGQPVLVDFSADWCTPCKMLAPTIDELADEYAGRVKVAKVDTEASRELANRYGIQNIPTVLLFKDGQMTRSLVGLRSKKDFKTALDEML